MCTVHKHNEFFFLLNYFSNFFTYLGVKIKNKHIL